MNSYFASGLPAEGEQTSFAMLAMPSMESGMTAPIGQSDPQTTLSVAVQPLLDIDPRAARKIIVYLAKRLQDPSFHRIAKLLYFADKLHLQRYGRLILGDRYVAMQYGPVPSFVYDMLKAARNANSAGTRESQPAFTVHSDGRTVLPLRSADLDWISDSERECLDEVIRRYGSQSFQALTNLSHDEAWRHTQENHFIELEQIVATLPDSESLLNHLLDNMRVNDFIQKNADLMACEVLLPAATHSFLSYDSWLDCREILSFQESELTDKRGALAANTIVDVFAAVQICPVLRPRFKRLIHMA